MAISDKKPPGNGTGTKTRKESGGDPWRIENGRRVRASKALPFENRINELLAGVSGAAMLAGDQFTADAITVKSPELAYGWAKVAQNDPRVKRVLTALFEGTAWAEALIPTVGLVIVVGWHYGMIPDRLGVPLSVANGLVPVSREAEVENRKREQAAAQGQYEASQGQRREDEGKGGDSN